MPKYTVTVEFEDEEQAKGLFRFVTMPGRMTASDARRVSLSCDGEELVTLVPADLTSLRRKEG